MRIPETISNHFRVQQPIRLDQSFKADLPEDGTVRLDGTMCEVYLDEQVALSARVYDHAEGSWGLFVTEGTTTFSNVQLPTP